MYSLRTLHEQLESCNKPNAYLHIVHKNGITVFEEHNTKQKHRRFSEIFDEAIRQMNEVAKNPEKLEQERSFLKNISEDGGKLRQRYILVTESSWTRRVLKILANRTPTFLKKYLPSCFSNQIKEAEEEAHRKFLEFIAKVNLLQGIPHKSSSLDPNPSDLSRKSDLERVKSQPKKIEDPDLLKEQQINSQRNVLRRFIQSIQKKDGVRPLSLNKFKEHLYKICLQIYRLKSMGDPSLQIDLEKEGLDASLFPILTSGALIKALKENDDQAILNLLKPTPWHMPFSQSISRKGWVEFNIQTLHGKEIPKLTNENKQKQTQDSLANYTGEILIKLHNSQQTKIILSQFKQFLAAHPQMHPCKIRLHSEFVDLDILNEIQESKLCTHDQISEIELDGATEIQLSTLKTAEKELDFVQNLSKFSFPNLKYLILTNHPKTQWTSQNYSELLFACPTLEMLNICYRLCPNYHNLQYPPQLASNVAKSESMFIFKGLCRDKIDLLLTLFKPQHLDFRDCELQISDTILAEWINKSYFTSVRTLFLNSEVLTTNALISLVKLENLTQLSLPELRQGTLSLAALPVFDNPFKVKLFYLFSKSTRERLNFLYTGNWMLAPLFQIPACRIDNEIVFSDQHKVLDSNSAKYWLHQNDFTKIKEADGIHTIFIDSNPFLKDANLPLFISKFPKVFQLSLTYCHCLTNRGIIDLLKQNETIDTLDLSHCTKISDTLFDDPQMVEAMKRLRKITITGTSISDNLVTKLKEQYGEKIVWERTTLKCGINLNFLAFQEYNKNIKKIDLSGCNELTNAILAEFFAKLSAPGCQLKLDCLNLTGCTKITDDAFELLSDPDEPTYRKISNLSCIVRADTKISGDVDENYTDIYFEDEDTPYSIDYTIEDRLALCDNYLNEIRSSSTDAEYLLRLKDRYIDNRIFIELFCIPSDLHHKALLKYKRMRQTRIERVADYSDFSLA